jgi:putative glutamine amidotransferase
MHPGTGTETVKWMMERLGVKAEIVTNRYQLDGLRYDGLILLGGCDINPLWYGEKPVYTGKIDKERDRIEWQLLRRAMSRDLPILGICRGHQLLSVAYGGSLYQDIYRQRRETDHDKTHRVNITGPLANHAATDIVNSLHHQAVRSVPDGFKVLARSTDGIVESIYKPGVLGVQWHPELLLGTDYRWSEIFRWFARGLE